MTEEAGARFDSPGRDHAALRPRGAAQPPSRDDHPLGQLLLDLALGCEIAAQRRGETREIHAALVP